jgi:hypothetical protein
MPVIQSVRGQYRELKINVYKQSDPTQFLSLDDCKLIFTCKKNPRDPDSQAMIQKSSGNGITHSTEQGKATLVISCDDTNQAPVGNYKFDLWLLTSDDRPTQLSNGDFVLSADITRNKN